MGVFTTSLSHYIQKRNVNNFIFFLFRYDYFTIMHIGCRAFSSIQGKTMEAKDDEVDDNDLGQRDGFSKSDIDRLKAAYVSHYF